MRNLILGALSYKEDQILLSAIRYNDISTIISLNLPLSILHRVRSITFSNEDDKTFSLRTNVSKFDAK